MFFSPHGLLQVAISIKVQPSDQMSAFQSDIFWRITSGAIQGIVPLSDLYKLCHVILFCIILAHPKSDIFTCPFLTKIFAHLRSWWTILWWCRKERPIKISVQYFLINCSSKGPNSLYILTRLPSVANSR